MPDLSPLDSEAGLQPCFNLVEMIHQPDWKTILLDLVRNEKMDPWNIDISELAQKYLQKINSMQEVSLRIPANAVLACAILLKIKAKTLRLSGIESELDDELREKLLEEVRKERESLFSELPNLENPRRIREGEVSLDELVSAIEEIISKSRKKQGSRQAVAPEELNFTVPIPTIDLEKETERLWEKILASADSTGTVLFSTLTIGASALQLVSSFIALLFLVNREKVNAFQEEFFGEIFIALPQTQEMPLA